MQQCLHFKCPYFVKTIMEFVAYKIPTSKNSIEEKNGALLFCNGLTVIPQVIIFLEKIPLWGSPF